MSAIFSPKLISGELVDDTRVRFCLRFVVAIAVTLPWRYMTHLINMVGLKNAHFTLWFAYLIPALIQGFFFFYVADLVSVKLGILTVKPHILEDATEGAEPGEKKEGADDEDKFGDKK